MPVKIRASRERPPAAGKLIEVLRGTRVVIVGGGQGRLAAALQFPCQQNPAGRS
jgi:hypothetical protein